MFAMKKVLYALLFLPCCLASQNMYNVIPAADNNLTGTARFVGMGGSMSALGGDVSVIGTNPAGIALFRSNDFSFTASVNFNKSEAEYVARKSKSDVSYVGLDNIGFVLSNPIFDNDWKYLNFGVNYNRKNNFKEDFDMSGLADGFSQQYIIDDIYRRNPFAIDGLSEEMYSGFNFNWLTLLMAEGYYGYEDAEDFITDPNGLLLMAPDEIGYYSEKRGGVDNVELNVSANYNDFLYLGVTLGFSNIDYSNYSCYFENDKLGEIYSIVNNYRVEGNGVNLKLGAIIRPFKYSPFKIGFAVHSPTWYKLTDIYSSSIAATDGYIYDTRDPERFCDEVRIDYKVSTPWRLNASMSYTFGTFLALNAEYEYADYSSMEFSSGRAVSKAQNQEVERNLKAQHTFRVGAECKLGNFSIRSGYCHNTSPFEKDAYKNLDNANITDTSTDYVNKLKKDILTIGGGYRYKNFYFDVAYMLQTQKADFYPFYDTEYENPAANVEYTNSSVIATMGIRF